MGDEEKERLLFEVERLSHVAVIIHSPPRSPLANDRSDQHADEMCRGRGIEMFDEPGIGPEDLAWIQRDEFVHYVGRARIDGNPHDWLRFRQDLLLALAAAFGLDLRANANRSLALELLDDIRARHDPAADWPAFFDALWEGRRRLRDDL